MEAERQAAEDSKENLQHAKERLQQKQAAVASAEKEIARLERLSAEKQARLEVLRQMNEAGEGLEKGSQAVLRGLDDPERIRPAIAGALVASLNVDPEFVPALEAAFGRNMHAVILRDTGLAAEIFGKLVEGKLGQAALAIPGFSASSKVVSSNLPDGALAWAKDKVEAPEELAALVRQLLLDVAIVPDLAKAVELKRGSPDLQFATLRGEFISREGIIFGGTANAASDSLLRRKAIVTSLEQECQGLEAERARSVEARDQANEQLESASATVEEARRGHETAHEKSSQTGLEILSAERAVTDEERKLAQLKSEKTTLEQQVQSADERLAQLERELEADRKNFAEEQGRQVAAEQARENARTREEETSEKLSELRLAVATERQRHESLL
ncbi:MAG: hypothetical protein LC642_02480, partial [Verrucomicrobiaceae bacterium]|nr:hypothetical protein [Verrucomicrobiaceae bacterium]